MAADDLCDALASVSSRNHAEASRALSDHSGIWLDAFVAVRHWSPDTSRIFSVLRAFARLHAEVFMHVRRRLKTGHLVNLYGSSLVWLGSSFYC